MSPELNSKLLESSGGVFGFEGYLVCLPWFHDARGQRFSCAAAVRTKRLIYPRKYMRRDRNGWVAQVRQKFWLRAVMFLFVVTQSETFVHEQQRGMCVLEGIELHHRFKIHAVGR